MDKESTTNNDRIYMDYASATPVRQEVCDAMEVYWSEDFGNPNSRHQEGVKAQKDVEKSRKVIADICGVRSSEVIFTSGATEANALSIRSYMDALEEEHGSIEGMEVVTSVIEHPSVLHLTQALQRRGVVVKKIAIGDDGIIDLDEVEHLLSDRTVLVSCLYANGEIGTIQPLRDLRRTIDKFYENHDNLFLQKRKRPVIHTDASQASLYLPLELDALGVDMMTINSQKIYGPKGVGVLITRGKIQFEPLFGGEITSARTGVVRPSTPAVPLIAGMSKALELAQKERDELNKKMSEHRDYFFSKLNEHFPNARINGSLKQRISSNISVTFPDTNHKFLAIQLDEAGISASTASACLDVGEEGSTVVSALDGNGVRSAIRFSLGRDTTRSDVEQAITALQTLLK